MKLQQILLQLFQTLPKYSSLFSTNVNITSLSLTGLTVTATTASPHNFITGQIVNIQGAIIRNPIVSLLQIDNIAYAETQLDHDLTENFNDTVEIMGANQSAYNGTHDLLTVPNRREFTFSVTGNPVTPATGTIFLNEVGRSINPYNGLKEITVLTPTTFTYAIASSLYSPPTGSIVASTGLRIGGALSIDKAVEWYSKQGTDQYWLFVVLNSRTANKDRFTDDDATSTTPRGTRFKQRVTMPFTCYVFAPLQDNTSLETVSGRAVRDSMEDVFYALCKSLLRKFFTVENFSDCAWSAVTFTNHDFYDYNQAYYVHQFSFENVMDINFIDTVEPDTNVAFRDIDLSFERLQDAYVLATAQINLDDVPLS